MTQGMNRRQFSAGLGLALGAGGLLVGCNKVPDTIRIGVAQPLSGPLAALGQDLLNGVRMAVDELHKNGYTVDSKRVQFEVLAQDDRADPAGGRAAAQQLVEAGVSAVIGHLNSGVSLEAAPIYGEKNIPQMIISTNPRITQLGLPTTFRIVANDALQARALGSFAASQLAADAYAVVDDGSPYGKGLADGAAVELEKAKKTIAVRQGFDDKTTQFAELAARLKASNVRVIVSMLNDFQSLALLEELRKLGHTRVALLGGDLVKTADMIKGMGLIDEIYATSPVLDVTEFTTGRQFLERYTAAFQQPPAYGGHYTYDAMYVVSEAIRKAGSAAPADITKALRGINGYAPVTGTMAWDEQGELRYGAVGVYQMRKGAWELRMRSDRW
ncbi:branched-chain amino acid ABC transporter substrate-binding protein [Melaminivora alkalimesophila]|uniref:Amino acid/amide ABC transporter substrate-binding protein (HAAT family) n=1 Tax=Melaminivora alkalimesophila TaxID=1165852 RepID=A0A317R9J0_9BURK|nr:branched-chain amino acid ABC transporter substrate-binding protein [Melaminivora alkalimesophila]PWW44564.1 amino acid/amide ABC transporter substrate-binding protein (HAAT family) [Melaminivora alkalimesophila]